MTQIFSNTAIPISTIQQQQSQTQNLFSISTINTKHDKLNLVKHSFKFYIVLEKDFSVETRVERLNLYF